MRTSPNAEFEWSVYGDLHNGRGKRVYHWQETSKKAGKGHVWWEFTYCGDGGKGHIWIDPSPSQRASFLDLRLDRNYCWQITSPVLGPYSKVKSC